MKTKNKDFATEHLHKILQAKQTLRRETVRLSFVEKIRRVIEMQRLASKFKRDPSRKTHIWSIK